MSPNKRTAVQANSRSALTGRARVCEHDDEVKGSRHGFHCEKKSCWEVSSQTYHLQSSLAQTDKLFQITDVQEQPCC